MAQAVQSTIQFPYKRSLGPVVGAFMTALTDRRIIGIRSGDRVIVPPLEWDPETAEELRARLRRRRSRGHGRRRGRGWPRPTVQHPLDQPFAFALIQLDGADTSLLHAVDAGSIDAMSTGMRVAPRWRAARIGHITDIEAFVPGEEPVVAADDGGPAEEPVTMMDYNASITYTLPVTPNAARAEQANDEGRFLGLQCPVCGRTYTGGKGYCPVDAIELTPRARGRPAAARHGHQLHDHHAGAVPGPDRDRAVRPGARAGSTTPT